MTPEIKIKFDDQSYVVYYVDHKGRGCEIAYGDKHTSMEDHAQNFYELAAALQVGVTKERG